MYRIGGFESRESHMNIFLGLVRDKRRISSSLHFQSSALLIAQIVEQNCQIEHDVKLSRHFCKTSQVESCNHRRVRFEDNVNQCNNHDNHDNHDNNDVRQCWSSCAPPCDVNNRMNKDYTLAAKDPKQRGRTWYVWDRQQGNIQRNS